MMQLLVGCSILISVLFIVYLYTIDIPNKKEEKDEENKRKFIKEVCEAQEAACRFQKKLFEEEKRKWAKYQ